MQFQFFTIPIFGDEQTQVSFNLFLKNKKILHVESNFVENAANSCWTFSVKYLDDAPANPIFLPKTDYRLVLDEATFARFSTFREIRKNIAKTEAVPAYAIFTDEELANLAKLDDLNRTSMQSVKGIGERKIEKYADRFLADLAQKT